MSFTRAIIASLIFASLLGFSNQSSAYYRCEDMMALDRISTKKWGEIARRAELNFEIFTQFMTSNRRFGVNHRLDTLEAHGRKTYLKELGFDFDKGTWPSFPEFLYKFDRLQLERMLEWNQENPDQIVDEENLVMPGFPFYNYENGRWIVAQFGHNISDDKFTHISSPINSFPNGHVLILENLIPGKVLYPSLGAGLFPIMTEPPPVFPSRDEEPFSTLFIHDFLAHQLSYLVNPDYADAYKWIAKTIVERGGWKYLKNKKQMFGRIFYFNEYFSTINTKVIDENLEAFTTPGEELENGQRFFKVSEIKSELEKLSDKELWDKADELRLLSIASIRTMGGLANDFMDGGYQNHLFSEAMGHLGFDYKAQFQRLDPRDRASERGTLITRLAKLQVLMLAMSRITAKQWAIETMNENSEESPHIRFIFQESGVFSKPAEDSLFGAIFYTLDSIDGFIDWEDKPEDE